MSNNTEIQPPNNHGSNSRRSSSSGSRSSNHDHPTRPASFAECNNAAIACVERGALSEAVGLFQMALAGARDHTLLVETERPTLPFLLEFPRESQGLSTTGGVVYTKPIAIVRSPSHTPNLSLNTIIVSDRMIVSAAILFNLAIVYHIRSGGQDLVSGTTTNTTTTTTTDNTHIHTHTHTHSTRIRRHNLLVQTKSLYEKTHQLLSLVGAQDDGCSPSRLTGHTPNPTAVIVDLIRMAVMNNLVRIHMSLDHQDIFTSQEGFACLGHLIRHSSRLLDISCTPVRNNNSNASSNRTTHQNDDDDDNDDNDCYHYVALLLREQAIWFLTNALLALSSSVLDKTIIKCAPAA